MGSGLEGVQIRSPAGQVLGDIDDVRQFDLGLARNDALVLAAGSMLWCRCVLAMAVAITS